jgi:hypothetical protein
MKRRTAILGTAVVLLLSIFFLPVTAQAADSTRVVFGGNFTLEDGERLDEDLTIFGGNATIKAGAVIDGSVRIFGGRLDLNGEVSGNISAAGGILNLGDEARIEGDVIVAGAVLDRETGAVIKGDLITDAGLPITDTRIDGMLSPFYWQISSFASFLTFVFSSFALAALAVLVVMFFEKPTLNIARTSVRQPALSAGMGCMTVVVLPLAIVILILSICLLPVGLVLVLAAGVVITFGWIGLGYEVGRRLMEMLKQDWAEPFSAGIGTFFLVIVGGTLSQIPCIGWLFAAVITVIGLGAVLLTRFGTQDYASMVDAQRALPVRVPDVDDVEPAKTENEDPPAPDSNPDESQTG